MTTTIASKPISPELSAKARFITRVYSHVLAAILALVALEVALFKSGVADTLNTAMRGVPWILILGGFMVVGWLARRAVWKLDSKAAHYGALAAYVVAKGAIVLPLLWRANEFAPGAIQSAAQMTLMASAALTLVVWWTRTDFTFLRSILRWGGMMALIAIIGGLAFGWHLGTWFNLGMVALAGGSILYDTSAVLKHHRRNRYVAEALSLFASIAMMFFYVLRQLTRAQR